jgi:hypothetical protein
MQLLHLCARKRSSHNLINGDISFGNVCGKNNLEDTKTKTTKPISYNLKGGLQVRKIKMAPTFWACPLSNTKAFPFLFSTSPSLAIRKPYLANGSNSNCKIEQFNVSINSKLMIFSSTTLKDC